MQEFSLSTAIKELQDKNTPTHYLKLIIIKTQSLIRANPQLADEVLLSQILPLLQDSRIEVRDSVCRMVEIMVDACPGLATPTLLAAFTPLTQDKSICRSASLAHSAIIKANPKLIVEVSFDSFIHLLSNSNPDIREAALTIIHTLVRFNPKLPNQTQVNAFKPLLQITDNHIYSKALKILIDIAAANPDLTGPILLNLLLPLLKVEDTKIYLAGDYAIYQVIAINPDANQTRLNWFIAKLSDKDSTVRMLALEMISILITHYPKLINKELLNVLAPLLADTNFHVGALVCHLIIRIIETNHKLDTSELLALVNAYFLDNIREDIQEHGCQIIKTLVSINPKLANDTALNRLIPLLKAPTMIVRKAAHEAIMAIIITNPALANEELLDKLMSLLLGSKDNMKYLSKTLVALVIINPLLATPALADVLLTIPLDNTTEIFVYEVMIAALIAQPGLIVYSEFTALVDRLHDKQLFAAIFYLLEQPLIPVQAINKPFDKYPGLLSSVPTLAWLILGKLIQAEPVKVIEQKLLQRLLNLEFFEQEERAPLLGLSVLYYNDQGYIDKLKQLILHGNLCDKQRLLLAQVYAKQGLPLTDSEQGDLAALLLKRPMSLEWVTIAQLLGLKSPDILARLVKTFCETSDQNLQDSIAECLTNLPNAAASKGYKPYRVELDLLLELAKEPEKEYAIISIFKWLDLVELEQDSDVSEQLYNFYQGLEAEDRKIIASRLPIWLQRSIHIPGLAGNRYNLHYQNEPSAQPDEQDELSLNPSCLSP